MLLLLAIVDRPLEGRELEGVTCVRAGDLWVAVRPVESAPAIGAGALREQDARVRDLAVRVAAILPFRFGTVARDEAALASLVERVAPELRSALERVRGREQMTLRLFGVARATADAPAPDVARATSDAAPAPGAGGLGPGARYLAERARALGGPVPGLDVLRRALGPLVLDERVERHTAPGFLASVYHLVARGTSPDYVRAVEGIRGPLRIRASGPFPPYAFSPELAS